MVEENEHEKYKIPLFDGSNYENWKFRMECLLDEKELLQLIMERPLYDEAVSSETANERALREQRNSRLKVKDKKCKNLIVQKIAESHLSYAMGKESAYDVWKVLEETYQRKSLAEQLRVRKMLLTGSGKHNPATESMEQHFQKFDKLIRQLKATGGKLEEIDIICHLLLSMPPEYNVCTTIETMTAENLSLNFVKNRLLDEESKRMLQGKKAKQLSEPGSSIAFSTYPKRGRGKSSRGNRSGFKSGSHSSNQEISAANKPPFPYNCHNCGLVGHKRSECKKPVNKGTEQANVTGTKEAEEDTTSTAASTNRSYAFAAQSKGLDEVKCINVDIANCLNANEENSDCFTWLVDSAASEHFISQSSMLVNIVPLENPMIIKVAKKKETMIAKEKGDIIFTTEVEGIENRITISGVLLVPDLNVNLLSVGKLETSGCKIVFEKGKVTISKNNNPLAVGNRRGRMYEVIARKPTEMISLTAETKEIWHKRLGHPSDSSLEKLENLVTGITNSKLDSNVCGICMQGKQCKLPHNQQRVRASRPLQLVHSDLCGPISPESYDGRKYMMTFVDDYTHFTVVYLLQSKSEAFKYFKIYEAMSTAHFNTRLSRFRCDNGREYISTEMKNYFEEKGIQFEFK